MATGLGGEGGSTGGHGGSVDGQTTADAKILFVHHFSLPSVSGITITIDDLVRLVPEVAPTVRAAAQSYEGCTTADHLLAVLRNHHGDATSVVGINLQIDVGWDFSRTVARWCAESDRPLYLYVHDYWPHHRPLTAELTERYQATLLAITPSIVRALEGDGFAPTLLSAGIPVPARSERTHAIGTTSVGARKTVAAMGRLVPRKRFHDVVQGFCHGGLGADVALYMRLIPSLVYTPAQDRVRLASIRAATATCPASPTVVIDQQPRTPTDYRAWSVYVSASEYEGLSMTPIEAVLQGCPPLVSDIPPHRAIIEQLYPGRSAEFIFPVGNHEALASLLEDEIRTGRRRAELAARRDEVHDVVERTWSLRTTAGELVRLVRG